MKSYSDGRDKGLDSMPEGGTVKRRRGRTALIVFGALVVIGAIGSAFGKTKSSDPGSGSSTQGNASSQQVTTTTASAVVTVAAAPWYPAGYQEYTDGIAFEWTNDSCGEGMGYCWHAQVIARDGCPTALYAELQVLDSSGAAIGMTNDLLGAVSPMQVAKLTFTSFDDNAAKAHFTSIDCY